MVKLDHLTLAVNDWIRSRDWYLNCLGLRVEFEIPERHVVALQDNDGFTIFLEQSPQPAAPSACILTFQVDNVDETHDRLTGRGIPFAVAPSKLFWGYGAELIDPDGYRIRLWDENTMKTKGV